MDTFARLASTALVTFATFASAASIAACAGPEDPASQYADLGAFCTGRAKAECNTQVVKQCGAKDAQTCVTARAAACVKNIPQGTVYVPAAAPDCIDAVAVAYANATITAAALDAMNAACAIVFSGPGPARSPCTVDLDCSTKDGLRCLVPVGETGGKCLAPNPVVPGGPCPGEADVCSDGYFCDPQARVCKVEGTEGETCSPQYQPCQKGLTCPGSLFGATCKSLDPAGVACEASADCASNLCDKAVGQPTGVCADQVQLTALDSMCADYK
jgi:hypothetical protein